MSAAQKSTFTPAVIFLVFLAILILLLNREKEPLTIGFVAGLSGKFADLGLDCRRGVELAIREINEKGGVNGREVQLLVRDDEQDPETARTIIRSFIDMNLPVVIGHATSSMSMATIPLINESDTLLISPTTSTPLLKDIDDNFIRTCAVSTDAAKMMAKYLREEKKADSVAVIYDTSNRAYTELWYKNFAKNFQQSGGTKVASFTFSSAPDLELLPLVFKARKEKPDALVIVANSVDAALLCQQVRKVGWQIPLALADWAATEQLINLGGEAVEGAVISQYFNRKSTDPRYLAFKDAYIEAFRTEPGFAALHSYNAAMVVSRAMEEKSRTESLKQAILRISEFSGLQGDITINKFGDSSNPTFIGVIQNGNFVILEDFR